MNEQPVFWRGGRPGKAMEPQGAPTAEALAPEIRAACEGLGLTVEEFVAALGGYGSWLVQVTRAGTPHRVIWNGKDARLSLDRALPRGGWEELRCCAVATPDAAGFVAGLRQLLASSADTPA